MEEAPVYGACYVLMIEVYSLNGTNQKPKTYAALTVGSKIVKPNRTIYGKEFLAVHFVLDTMGNIIWG